MKLEAGQHAFITGGASGLGLGIADALAARGLKITLADANEDALAQVLASRGADWRGTALDVRDRAGWAQARSAAEAAFGPVGVLVNNAGIAPNGKGFADMAPESFDRILAINLGGVFNGVSTFAAAFRDRGWGHVVNTSSMAGLQPSVNGIGAYATAKFGVTALTESLRKELAGHGVGVTLLCPGYVATGLSGNTLRLGGDLREGSTGMALPPAGVTSAQVGDMVVAAIEADEACVITHAGSWPEIGKRMDALRAACDLADARGLGAR